MALPKIQQTLFEITIPSIEKKVYHRLFTVKEEKILLIAQESKDPSQALLAMKQVVNNCLIDVNIEELALFDLEYLLLSIRGKSVDNKIEFSIKDPDTGEQVNLALDIEDVKIVKDPNHSHIVKLDDEYSLFLKYPTINQFAELMNGNPNDPEASYKVMVSCFDQMISENEVIKFSEYSEEEITKFTDDLDANVVKNIRKFFDTIPKLRHELKYTNSNGAEKTFVIEGMEAFFI